MTRRFAATHKVSQMAARRSRKVSQGPRNLTLEQLERRQLFATYVVGDGNYPGGSVEGHKLDIVSPAGSPTSEIRVANSAASHSFAFSANLTNSVFNIPSSHGTLPGYALIATLPNGSRQSFPATSPNSKTLNFAGTLVAPVGSNTFRFIAQRSPGGVPQEVNVQNALIEANVRRNILPVPGNNDFSVSHGGSANRQLSVSDADNDSLIYSLQSDASHGAVTLQTNGSFNYQTDNNTYLGSDSFTFTVFDGFDTVAKTVNVNIGNLPPVAPGALQQSVAEGQAVDVDLSTGFVDPEGDPIDPASVVILQGPSNGTATVRVIDGKPILRYVPNSAEEDQVVYTLKDTLGAVSASRTLSFELIAKPRILGLIDDVVPNTSELLFPAYTNDVSPILKGTAEAGSSIIVYGLSTNLTTTANAAGQWQVALASVGLSTSTQTYTVRAEATLGAVTSVGDPVMFTIDTTSPVVSSDSPTHLRPGPITSKVRFFFTEPSMAADGVAGFELADLTLRKSGSVVNRLTSASGATLVGLTPASTLPAGFSHTFELQGLAGITAETGSYDLTLNAVGSGIVDPASNPLANSLSSKFAVDATPPLLTAAPQLTTATVPSGLPVPVVDTHGQSNATVSYSVRVTDQQFSGFGNSVTYSLVEIVNGNEVLLNSVPITIPASAGNDQLNYVLAPTVISASLPAGQHQLQVKLLDKVGNQVSSQKFFVFVSQVADPKLGTPGTPALTEQWYIGAKVTAILTSADPTLQNKLIEVDQPIRPNTIISINGSRYEVKSSVIDSTTQRSRLTLDKTITTAVGDKVAWLRPWTTSFDKETQTTWLTMEDGVSVGQFDPATGRMNLFDVGASPDGTAAIYGDPHGVSFDFNTHLQPRVWYVYRNSNLDQDLPMFDTTHGQFPSTLAYLDVATKTLNTVLLNSLALISAKDTTQHSTVTLAGTHAIFTDTRGHIWVTAEDVDPPAILEINLSRTPAGAPNSLNSSSGTIIVHDIPVDQLGGSNDAKFTPHGLTVEVDQVTGAPYVFLSDGAGSDSSKSGGRVVLLRPGVNGLNDQWTEWNFDEALAAEGNRTNGTALFLTIDNNETPGDLRDDRLVVTDPAALARRASGTIRVLDLGQVLGSIVEQDRNRFFERPSTTPTLPATGRVTTYVLPAIPGANPPNNSPNSSPQVPFVDRAGQVFYVDATGSFGRFNLDADNSQFRSSIIAAPLKTVTSDGRFGAIDFADARVVSVDSFQATRVEVIATGSNQSNRQGLNQYYVGSPATITYGGAKQPGMFRGALDAENTFFGALSNSDQLTTTVIAEANRRQVAVVPSPLTPPTGSRVTGRAIMQVLRDGSVVLTARGDGELLDKQFNLTKALLTSGRIADFDMGAIFGDIAATANGTGIEALGRAADGTLVRYRYRAPSNSWKTAELSDVRNWTVSRVAMPSGQVAAEDPTPSPGVGFTVTTASGHLVVIKADGTAVDLNPSGALPLVYSGVGTLVLNGRNHFFGSTQTGTVVRYSTNANLQDVVVKTLNINGPATDRPALQFDRDLRMLRNIRPLLDGDTVHLFSGDGVSRLVHYELSVAELAVGGPPADTTDTVRRAENVTQLVVDNQQAFGYFEFAAPFAGRIYTYMSPLKQADGTLRVYGTNGGGLIEFTRDSAGKWRVGNLTNDIRSTDPVAPAGRVPANAVFGAPSAYQNVLGERHILQINVDGEIIEYYTLAGEAQPRFHTQNINLRIGTASKIVNLRYRADAPGALTIAAPPIGSSTPSSLFGEGLASYKMDVNDDGIVTAMDVLWIINRINRGSTLPDDSPFYGDVDGNGEVTPLDALLIINRLNSTPLQGEGEGLSSGDQVSWLGNPLDDIVARKKRATEAAFANWEN